MSNKNDKVKAIMEHSLQMNTLRTGQIEVGGSNESGQTEAAAVVKTVREKKLMMSTRVMP